MGGWAGKKYTPCLIPNMMQKKKYGPSPIVDYTPRRPRVRAGREWPPSNIQGKLSILLTPPYFFKKIVQ
jgi:hypothetical protein